MITMGLQNVAVHSTSSQVDNVDMPRPFFVLPTPILPAFIRSLITHFKTWLLCLLLDILATGPTPRHVAFVMDGNRRYARRLGKQGKEGHSHGFKNLHRVLGLCVLLRIHCVTVYAFAIENLNRSKEEVDTIMKLAEKVVDLVQPGAVFDRFGVRLNVLGRRELLPPSVQALAEQAEKMTRHNNTMILNVCGPYASQDEITTAVESVIREAIDTGDLDGSTITEDSIDSHLSTSIAGSPPLDILVRTGGDKRLSGFLTWQCCEHTQIHILDKCWPELGLFDLVPILLEYQRKVWAEERR
ncbi:Undecaprenyl diphosphate synthase [Imleria badia]|nr:Undecaprenyl diphosphate synthase [Imleria badia]